VILAEFHEGGFTIGRVEDPLSVANWELRIAHDGSLEQRVYDEQKQTWRYFQGKPLVLAHLQNLIQLCQTLPRARAGEESVTFGVTATDTTYLHIVLRMGDERRDVFAFRNQPHPANSKEFVRIWRAIAQVRPIAQTPSGGY
jgi:hypothetical protein